jgi:PQQ-like domain
MRFRPVGVAALLACGVVLAACRPVAPPPTPAPPPPPPPAATPPPPPGVMSLGWTAPGVNGPIATDVVGNAVWAMNKGTNTLWELNAASGSPVASLSVPLDPAQHFPTPEVSSGWAIIERSNNQVVAFKTTNTAITWTSPVLDGLVQARPLVVGNIVVVATENDSLYGLNLADGTFAWTTPGNKVSIGTPEPLTDVHQFPGIGGFCGDIDPLGITSNPVLDGGTVYAVGEIAGAYPVEPQHVLVGITPATGAETLTPKVVDVVAMTEAAAQQQRAGLVAANGKVYVGFGGLAGDCATYHGFVVAANETSGAVVGSFEVASVSNAGAVWGTSGPVADGSGNVYASTGNSLGTAGNVLTDYSDGVVRLAPNMPVASTVPADYFQPTVWRQDNAADADLGSTGPVLLPNGTQLFMIGKQHTAFLLNTNSLGGSDHMTPVGSLNACSGQAFGQNAAISNSSVYVACTSGIQQVKIS